MPEGMNFGVKKDSSPEELKQLEKAKQDREDAEQLAAHFAIHPEQLVPKKTLSESEADPKIAEFKAMIASFESAHPLAELNSIIDLTPAEAPKHPVREPARIALIPITAIFNTLGGNKDFENLKAQYKRLSRAVGMINNNKVDHTR